MACLLLELTYLDFSIALPWRIHWSLEKVMPSATPPLAPSRSHAAARYLTALLPAAGAGGGAIATSATRHADSTGEGHRRGAFPDEGVGERSILSPARDSSPRASL